MDDRGDVISIKFSYDMKVLAVQRSKTSVVSLKFAYCKFISYYNGFKSHVVIVIPLLITRYCSIGIYEFQQFQARHPRILPKLQGNNYHTFIAIVNFRF